MNANLILLLAMAIFVAVFCIFRRFDRPPCIKCKSVKNVVLNGEWCAPRRAGEFFDHRRIRYFFCTKCELGFVEQKEKNGRIVFPV